MLRLFQIFWPAMYHCNIVSNFISNFYFYFSGCGHDWAVSSLSRLLTVLYLLVGLPVMYLYLTSTGHLLARVICISMRGILLCTKTRSQHQQSHLKSSNASSRRSSSSHSELRYIKKRVAFFGSQNAILGLHIYKELK